MGRFQGSKPDGSELKAPEKEASARSRIPRLVLRPYLPQQKASPSSESPLSEEESKDHGSSARTPSSNSNSFCSDDTGCPSSQCVSPVKTPPSDPGNSPIGFHTVSEEEYAGTKLSPPPSGDGNAPTTRHKKEQKACLAKPGSEADFSSSSSTGSISAPEVHMSTTAASTAPVNKRSSFSRIRGPHGRVTACCSSHKAGTSPPVSRDKDVLSMLGRNPISPVNNQENYGASSASSSNSGSYKGSETSPTLRRTTRYNSCGDNHGIKPPNPEQYLTPLQQKEVAIRHLKTKLKEFESRLQERETEIEDLKSQLARMREDWIEEECHRVEAQLALKEARKEIKQLKQFIETMKSSLEEKDKGIQKYFIDINIQNKKLESLLHNMELAQNGSVGDEPSLEYLCDSPGKSVTESTMYGKMAEEEDQAVEEMADSGLLLNDDMANKTDVLDDILNAPTIEHDHSTLLHFSAMHTKSVQNLLVKLPSDQKNSAVAENPALMEQAIQTDVVPYSLDVEKLVLTIFKSHYNNPVSASSALWVAGGFHVECVTESTPPLMLDLTPNDPNSAILLSPTESPCNKIIPRANANRAMKELDFEVIVEEFQSEVHVPEGRLVKKYWSNSLLVDVLAIAVPIIPTIIWACSTQRGASDPIYNMGTLLRGCCLMGLHSLRRMPFNLEINNPALH